GSTACGFASGMVPLILFRTAQGLGAGAIQPLAITIVGDIYAPADRARMQGWLSSIWGISAVLGPALGALIVEIHWPLIFWINIPIGIVAIALLALAFDERMERRRQRIDYGGAVLLMLGLGAVMMAAVQATTLGARALGTLAGFGALMLLLLAFQERRVPEPIVPFKLWRHRVLAIGNFGGVALGALIIGNGGFLPTYIQGVLGFGPAMAGTVLATSSVAWSATGIVAGRMMARHSYRATGMIGAALMIAGALFLATLDPARGVWPAWLGALLCGSGLGFCNTTFIVSAQTSVGWSERGIATASNMFMRTAGQSFAAALFGAILNLGLQESGAGTHAAINQLLEPTLRRAIAPDTVARLAAAIAHSLHYVYLVSLAVAVVTLALTWAFPKRLGAVETGERRH
ncbi:MAG: MFS transporter, partial [Stellaceae bacterium]